MEYILIQNIHLFQDMVFFSLLMAYLPLNNEINLQSIKLYYEKDIFL